LFAGLLLTALALAACDAPPEAPEELSDPSAYLFRNFESTEEGSLELGMGSLYEFLAGDIGDDGEGVAYTVESLTADDVADVERPDRDPEDTQPVAVGVTSAFGPAKHAEVIILDDQTPVEPNSPDQYAREFTEPTDPSCFPGNDCDLLRTMNDIVKNNAFMTVPYMMHKDYRWVEVGEAGSGEWGILGRSWCEEEAIGEQGNNEILQSYSIDVFFPHDGGGIRYMALWSENTVPGFSDEQIQGTIEYGINQVFDATEEYLEEN